MSSRIVSGRTSSTHIHLSWQSIIGKYHICCRRWCLVPPARSSTTLLKCPPAGFSFHAVRRFTRLSRTLCHVKWFPLCFRLQSIILYFYVWLVGAVNYLCCFSFALSQLSTFSFAPFSIDDIDDAGVSHWESPNCQIHRFPNEF